MHRHNDNDPSCRPKNYEDLRKLDKADMIRIFDSLAPASRPGGVEFNDPNFWLAEIWRKDQEESTGAMLAFTRWITAMTVVVALATLAMLAITVWRCAA